MLIEYHEQDPLLYAQCLQNCSWICYTKQRYLKYSLSTLKVVEAK